MKISSSQLINDLQNITQENLLFAENILSKSENELNARNSEKSWSTLECIEHLNWYGNFYIPEISNRISSSKTASNPIFLQEF